MPCSDERDQPQRAAFVAYLQSDGHAVAADDYLAKMREIDNGISGARGCWAAMTATQRRALTEANIHGGRLDRDGKGYRHASRNQPYRPIYAASVRNLCRRDLMAWDGGAFDPEASAVVTERGRFVLKHGEPA